MTRGCINNKFSVGRQSSKTQWKIIHLKPVNLILAKTVMDYLNEGILKQNKFNENGSCTIGVNNNKKKHFF